MRRIALMFIAALVALIGLVPLASTAQAGPSVEAAAYTYDTPEYDPPGNGAASERGPPAQGLATTACDADRWSRGTLARSDVLAAPAITTYGYLGTPARVARPMTTTGAHVVLVDGDRSSLSRFGVAAKSADEVADIGHAGLRHQFPNTLKGKSQFYDGIDLGDLASRTKGMDGFVQANGNTRYVLRNPGGVGVDRTTGLPTDVFTVIRRGDGSVVTMFPGTSPKG